MKVVIAGSGYVGLVTGACLADIGVDVCCVDVDQQKIDNLQKGILPIFEPGLEDIVNRNVKSKRLHFSTSIADHIKDAGAVFIAVGTPAGEDGSADMQYVLSVADSIGQHLEDYTVVVTKSTVPVGSSEKVRATINKALEKRGQDIPFDVVSNPEFLKEGAAIKDFMSPDRIVVGIDSNRARETMDTLYKPFLLNGYRILYMDIPSAEMTKYAANAMLATRISFMNDIANLCEKVGANVSHVRAGIGTDPRIGRKFLYPGVGYGGSCFPKDVKALLRTGKDHQYPLRLLEAVEAVNDAQKKVLFDKINRHYDQSLEGKTIAVWGLAFKPNTDDMREAPALVLIEALLASGAKVQVYDPEAMKEARKVLSDKVKWAEDVYDSVKGADAIALITEWNAFRLPNWNQIKSLMQTPVVFDGRNIYDDVQLTKAGFIYYGIGQ
ncbi:UDP-glucose dehydrogenase family protein [Arachidicoccus terrestris]|uniref:UDP-glucose dehydrogenase family protein n=1 Tax=Arachidicoccus terrestris TaxID=2875539 RepID=UPI001CC7DA48|nr:UDP-glucose/GDP-mannose dehydrogenase family protein [Arachidicoccus terrestris]UAY54751.1 UDP-glucose/GDP-mannose dehydrogenase family protein [Arachidicoccus terrestris]